jgi:hypothetical protein
MVIVFIVAIAIYIVLRDHPVMRGLLISLTGIVGLVRFSAGHSVVIWVVYPALILWGVLALIPPRSDSSDSRSPRSIGDTSTIGWYSGPNNPTRGRFDHKRPTGK